MEKLCLYCKKPVYKKDRTGSRCRSKRYCSSACAAKHRSKLYIDRWLVGEESGSQGKNKELLSQYVRNFLLEESNYQCSQCGWGKTNPFSSKIPLEIDHIDGDSLNNKKSNLRVLCPNCHSLTEFFGSLNTGRGRRIYRQRYHDER